MATNQTIDGVSLELIQSAMFALQEEGRWDVADRLEHEMRTLLNAKPKAEPVAYLCKAGDSKWLQYGARVSDPWRPEEVELTPLYTEQPAPVEVINLSDCVEHSHPDYGRGWFATDNCRRLDSGMVGDQVSVQTAWEACGGNPGIKATREELLSALRLMNEAEDEQLAPVAVLPERLQQVLKFLDGSGELDGYSFGQFHQSGRKFWWRNELRACLDEVTRLNTK